MRYPSYASGGGGAGQSPSTSLGAWTTGLGFFASAAGLGLQTVGAYYAATSQKQQARAAAMAADFEESQAFRNARLAEVEAQSIREVGRAEIAQTTLAYGQVRGELVTSQAARGLAVDGSALEQRVALEFAKELDALTIDANAVRASSASRMQAVDWRNRGAMARVSASNMRATARSIKPGMAARTALLAGVGGAGQSYAMYDHYRSR